MRIIIDPDGNHLLYKSSQTKIPIILSSEVSQFLHDKLGVSVTKLKKKK